MFSLKHNCIVTIKFMGVQINEYEAVYVNMRRNSFAFVAMSVIAAALMCSLIPSGSFEFVYAEEDESTQDNDSEENQHDGDESDNEDDGDNARSQDDDSGDEDENDENDDDESSRSQDDDESEDGNEDGDDSSETGTEQESEQKNVCSGWAVCINVATNAESSTIGGGLPAQAVSETPMLLSLPL
jgi:hypothetical protein